MIATVRDLEGLSLLLSEHNVPVSCYLKIKARPDLVLPFCKTHIAAGWAKEESASERVQVRAWPWVKALEE